MCSKRTQTIFIPIFLFIALAWICFSNTGNAGANTTADKAQYLLDEDFAFLATSYNPNDLQISGWDVRSAGGSISYSYYSWFKVSDTSNVLPVSLTKKFDQQENNKITLEYRFKPTTVFDGIRWQLRSGNTVGVSIYTSGSNLYVDTPGSSPTLLQPYAANTEYGIKVIAYLSQKKADIFINGVLKGSNLDFKNSVSCLDNFSFATGEASKGEVYLSTVKIYKGYTVNERFVTTMAGVPGDWSSNPSGGTIAAEDLSNASPPDYYGLKMDAANSTAGMILQKNFAAQSGAQVFEYSLLIPQKTDGLTAELLNGSTAAFQLVTANGKLCYVDRSGQTVPVYDYLANLWYSIKVNLDTTTSKADIYINGKLKAQGVDFASNVTAIDGIRYTTNSVNKGKMYLDDIQFYEAVPLPLEYVPAPQKISANDMIVGTQSCSMWREGTHLGWDRINPYPERKPILGFYDEGNPETADWEIKWMVEHGISYELFCWFRPYKSVGQPIKDPDLSAALNEGFFNAKYSDQMKFAIAWENGASRVNDSSDFRNNVVPYWMEYYFKDPRYLVIDNKPVISIYSLSRLKSFFGGTTAGVKAETDYLRQACVDAGFDGAILLISYSDSNPVTMGECKAAGFDAVYAYSWGSLSGHEEIQKTKLTQQRDAGSIDMVPVISMGRDDTAWGGSMGYFSTTDEFKSVAQWTKDTLMPSLPDTSPGKKMVLLDNWNEYGEGHFLLPTALNGFGYLDAVREVFGDGTAHQDVQPTQAQKDRVCVLYHQDRVLPVKTVVKPQITNVYSKEWNFDTDGDSEGWDTIVNDVTAINVQNGAMSVTSTGYDPWMVSPYNLGFSGDDNPYIHIRMKNGANDANARIYFITEADQTWNETKSVAYFVKPNDSGYTDYYVDMWSNSKWTGKIKAFRIDPIGAPGSFSIDSIGAVYSPITGIKTYFDGQLTKLANQPKVIDNCAMVPIEDIYAKLGIPKQWDESYAKLIAVRNNNIFELTEGVAAAYKDGAPMTLEHAPVLEGNVLYVPASYIKQAFGYIVSWNTQDQQINIYTSSLAWNFTDAEGFTANERISNVVASNGYYNGTSAGTGETGEEGYILSKDKLGMDAAAVKRIRVNIRNSSPGKEFKLYFTTSADPIWDTNKMLILPAIASDSQYREYVFDTYSFHLWSGEIKQIKLVPTNIAGDFSIDSIKMDITSSVPAIGENIVADPGMELGSSTQIITSQVLREYSTAPAHSGNQSIKVTKQGTYGSIYFKTLQQVKGQEYYYSAWLKLDADSVSLKNTPPAYPLARVCLQYKLDGVVKQKIILSSAVLSTSEWRQVQGTYTINETGTVTDISMYIYTDVPAALDTYYLDDVEIRPIMYTTDPAWVYVSGVSMNKTSADIGLGKAQALRATVQPANAINRAVRWSSDNPAVAIVDNNGTVYGKSEGTANITVATVEGGKTATCAVTVKEGAYETVILTVRPDGTGDFISPKLANDSITDSSAEKRYEIVVYPGVYTEKNWVVKQYTTIRGTDRDTCWLKGENPENATNNEITNQSTLWLQPTANLENLKITCKNMRYPVHSEANGTNKDAVHNVTNCYIEHFSNLEAVQYRQKWIAANPGAAIPADLDPNQVWGGATGYGSHAWGYGSASGLAENFYNCEFVSKADGWYVHNREDFTKPQINIINNSRIVSTGTSNPVSIQSLGSGTKDQSIFNNCEFVGTYLYQNDAPWITQKPENQYANHADYTVTLNNCNPIGYLDGHRGRALAIFSSSTGSSSFVRVSGDAVPDLLGQYITRDGGGSLKGYLYGYWDISGIKVGLTSNIVVNNTLGRRLGNCTVNNKTLNIAFEDGTSKTVVFNEDYTNQPNTYVLQKINAILGTSGTAVEYNVTANEYYPQVPDKQVIVKNDTKVGIPRFSAVCYDLDSKTIRLMKATDSANVFLGITLEPIAPGQSGRVHVEGIMHKSQLCGFSGSIGVGTNISISTNPGSFTVSGSNPVLKGIRWDWAYFKGNRSTDVIPKLNVLEFNADKTVLKPGETALVTLAGKMSDGTTADLSRAQIVYTSENEQVAAVNTQGTVTAVGEGTAKIQVVVTLGEVEMTKELLMTVDVTAPQTSCEISGTSENGWYNTAAIVGLAATDNVSGVKNIEYRLDPGSEWQKYVSAIPLEQDGNYVIEYRSADNAGNVEEIQQEAIKIDRTAPVTTGAAIGVVRDDGTYNSHVVLSLTSEDTAGGSGLSEMQYSLDGIHWLEYTAPLNLNDDGSYFISIKASDIAGNTGATDISVVLSMDSDVMVTYLNEKVNAIDLHQGTKNSLTEKLDITLNYLQSGDETSAVNQLKAFINEVEAQTGKKITVQQATELKVEVNKIKVKIEAMK